MTTVARPSTAAPDAMTLVDEASATEKFEPAGAAELEWEVVRDDDRGLDEWRSLDERLANEILTCSWDWVDTWVRVFGDVLPHRFVIARCAGQPVGIVLLVESARRAGPFRIRTLHLGTAGEPEGDSVCVEDNRSLVDPEYRAPFMTGLWSHIDADSRWDALSCDGLAAEEAAAWVENRPVPVTCRVPCHYFDLRETRDRGESVLDRLGKSTRRNVRLNLKHFGDLTLDWAETPAQADEVLDDLIRLHQQRWTSVGQPGCFASERFTRIHRQLMHRLLPQKRVVLIRVRRGTEPLGCSHLFVERNRLLVYQGGFPRLMKHSPGLITDYLSMQAGLERGYDAFDFLAGDSNHKRCLSTTSREIVWLTWQRPRWKFKAIELLKSARRLWKSRVGQASPNNG